MLQHGFVNHIGARGVLPPVANGKFLYVADYQLSVIFVYDASSKNNPQPLGFIADGVSYPAAIAFDSKHNLYVANEGTSTVTVYAPGSTKVAKTVSTIFPFALAFGPDGTLYVTGNDANAGNEVEIFSPKKTKPTFIPTPFKYQSDGVAVSAKNLLTITVGSSNRNGYIYTYPNGLSNPVEVASNIGLLEGLAYDSTGHLYASAFTENQVLVYTPPAWGSPQTISNGIGSPVGLTVGTLGLYVADSQVPAVASFTSVNAAPVFFNRDMTFVTGVGLSDTTLSNDETTLYTVQECNCSEVDIYSANLPPQHTSTIGQGVHTPTGVWIDDGGNLFVANYSNSQQVVTEFAAGSHTPEHFWAFGKPFAVAVDHLGTLYVSDQSAGAVEIVPAGKSVPTGSFGCGNTYGPQHLTVDPANNVYVACGTDVLEYSPSTKTTKLLGLTGLSYALGVAFDKKGNLYVSDETNNKIDVYAPKATTASRVITSGLNIPAGIHIGASGRLYVANLSGASNPIYAPNGSVPIGTITGVNLQDIATGP